MRVFVTGATGLLGGELLVTLSRRAEIERIDCLARPKAASTPEARLRAVFDVHGDPFPEAKIRAVPGDLCELDLAERLAGDPELARTTTLVHAAADTSFSSQSSAAIERTNVEGLERLLTWAERLPSLETFLLVSTAAVCGSRLTRRVVTEDLSPDPGAPQLVAYTASKLRGELLVRRRLSPRQVLVARPSIVLGDSRGLRPRSPVVAWAVAAINRLRLVPVDPHARLDVVPVDFVADALTRLLFATRRHDVYHVSSSDDHATSAHALAGPLAEYFDDLPPFRFVPSEHASELRRLARRVTAPPAPDELYFDYWRRAFGGTARALAVLSALRPYFAFMELDQVFDASRLFEDTGLASPAPAHVYLARQMAAIGEIDVMSGSRDP